MTRNGGVMIKDFIPQSKTTNIYKNGKLSEGIRC